MQKIKNAWRYDFEEIWCHYDYSVDICKNKELLLKRFANLLGSKEVVVVTDMVFI